MYKNAIRFPLADYVRVVYNDALTYDATKKQGGMKAHFLYPKAARAPYNRHLQGLITEFAYKKSFVEDLVLDKMS